ncbi:MAG: glycosyltransferase family 9 protein [Bdellovibrionia bacterium]
MPGIQAKKILVFRALQLGDLLCAVPAFRALRSAFPDAEITLVGLPWAKAFVERFSRYFDSFLELPGFPGLLERKPLSERIPEFIKLIQAEEYDLALQMHGCGTITNPLVSLFGAKACAGFFTPGQYCPDPEKFIAYPANEPEVWRHLRLMQHLGVPLQGEFLEFEVERQDMSRFRAIPGAHALRPGEYVCIHPGARAEWRRWPPEKFAAVADELARRGLQVVITGSAEERKLADQVRASMDWSAHDFTGHTDLGSLAALLSGARLLICNDTGVSHLAAALRVPSVVVFWTTDLAGWPPLDRQLHRSVCRITGVSPDDVLAHAESLMSHWDPELGSADLAA